MKEALNLSIYFKNFVYSESIFVQRKRFLRPLLLAPPVVLVPVLRQTGGADFVVEDSHHVVVTGEAGERSCSLPPPVVVCGDHQEQEYL